VSEFLGAHSRSFVVEQNRDAQLRSLLTLETGTPRDQMISILDYGGVPLSAQPIVDAVSQHEGVTA
jgi:2-oxoglutarate ferredoxin oxidoreductase subunit alpha